MKQKWKICHVSHASSNIARGRCEIISLPLLPGLIYSTFSLFSTVIFLIVASHINGWKMDKRYGVVLMVWYFVFIVFASLYELNVFGDFNPPECACDPATSNC